MLGSSSWASGWLASPLDHSTVTVPTPVTLVSGITLTSGTLVYYPVNHPEQAVTLNASTTGTGQIGTFDPTLLNNGAYFIILTATNSHRGSAGDDAQGNQLSWDEYPFAITYQGGVAANGVGADVAPVPLDQNSLQGNDLRWFFAWNNVYKGCWFNVVPVP